jgi:hypothetical protein
VEAYIYLARFLVNSTLRNKRHVRHVLRHVRHLRTPSFYFLAYLQLVGNFFRRVTHVTFFQSLDNNILF